jgi:hypothetical protein
MARSTDQVQARAQTIEALELLRPLLQAVIDYNQPLLRSPRQQASATRRITEATRQLDEIERQITELRGAL